MIRDTLRRIARKLLKAPQEPEPVQAAPDPVPEPEPPEEPTEAPEKDEPWPRSGYTYKTIETAEGEATCCDNPFWVNLHPSTPSGTYRECTRCRSNRFVPTERCRCAPGNHGVSPVFGNPYRTVRPNRTIDYGVCSVCGHIVPGYEEEADTYACNW